MTQTIDRRNRVTVRPVRPRIVTVNGATVARLRDMRGRTQVRPSPVNAVTRPVNPRTIVENRAAPGKDGKPGADGAGNIPPINYSFGDAPHTIYTPTVAGTVTLCRVVPIQVFNGTNPRMKIGTMAIDDSILPTNYTSLKEDIEIEFTPDVHLAANEAVILTMLPGVGTTQGNGKIFLAFVPDP